MLDSLVNNYSVISKIGEGSFSKVLKVRDLCTGNYFAAKRLLKDFMDMEEVEDCNEIKTLKKLDYHPNVLILQQCVYEADIKRLTLIFNLMDMSLYDYIKDRNRRLSEQRCQNYIFQLIQGVDYLHSNGIFHRDIKPENILLSHNKTLEKSNPLKAQLVQLGDLGSAAFTAYKQPRSEYISTRWYRAPECLLTSGYYGPKMDIWAMGCCFYEMLTLQPLFPGENEIDQLHKIHEIIGTPTKDMLQRFKHLNCHFKFVTMHRRLEFCKLVPNLSNGADDVLKKMLSYHPDNRSNTTKLLTNTYFNHLKHLRYNNDRGAYLSNSDSRTTQKSRNSSKNPSCNGSTSSIRSNRDESLNLKLDKSKLLNRLELVQNKAQKHLERNWNRNQPRDVKKEIVNNQNSISENQQKTVSHPSLTRKKSFK